MFELIKYKGKEYPVRLSYKAIKGLKKDLGEVNVDALSKMDGDILETLLWHGLISGHAYQEKMLTLKREEMEDILDESMMDFVRMIPKFFPNTLLGNGLPDLGGEKVEDAPKKEEQSPST